MIKERRRKNKNIRLFYSSSNFTQFKLVELNWKLISKECMNLTKTMMSNNFNNSHNNVMNFDLIKNGNLIINTILYCPLTINMISKIPNIIYAGFSILNSNSKKYNVPINKTLTYNLGLNISNSKKTSINIGNYKMLQSNGNSYLYDSSYYSQEVNYSDFDRAILVIIIKK